MEGLLVQLQPSGPGQIRGHVQEPGLVQLREENPQAEALGQGGFVLNRLVGVNFVAAAVGEVLPDQVAAVGGAVDGHVPGPRLQTALQNGLEAGEGLVLPVEGEVVDEDDELLRVLTQQPHQPGQLGQGVPGHLHQTQALELRHAQHGLDGGALAGAAGAVEQHIVHLPPGHQGAGVLDDLAALALVAPHLVQIQVVGLRHGVQLPLLPDEGPVAGEPAAAVDLIEVLQLIEVQTASGVPLGQGVHHALPARRTLGGQRALELGAGQVGQPLQQGHVPPGGLLQGAAEGPPGGGEGEGALVVAQVLQQVGGQALVALPGQCEEHL